ncbi:MAG: tRNA (N(6)-L-threonylcarbamoyladenosine(37)-C(2))-methylthiotransferase MtaB, partial [Chloroflexota bacterium]|nr:tRNA (N(6)-L-threonylcarbamoyladenosine(37)-C(2))-methylthiotransferase MtaB [Chloroflexota bacterium]
MVRVAFYTLGCKLNQAETEDMSTCFCQAGFRLVPPNAMADIYIANTCTVTHVADRKARHWLRLSRRRNPRAMIVAVGCYVQRAPEELSAIADLVVDNRRKERLLEIVSDWLSSRHLSPHREHNQLEATAGNNLARVRSLIKIQEGCRTPCSYCIVPRVRAHEISHPASQIIEAIQEKVAAGFREVVITGTKVGCYQEAGGGLEQLVERILRETDIERLRISSLQPQEIS